MNASQHTGKYELTASIDNSFVMDESTRAAFLDALSGVATATWADDRLIVSASSGDLILKAHKLLSSFIHESATPLPIQLTWGPPDRSPEIVGIEFDLSFRGHGISKSWFFREYMRQSPIVRIGFVFVKRWSKATLLNHNKKGHFNSFAITILWLHFLLVRKLAIFVDPAPFIDRPTSSFSPAAKYLPLWEPHGDGKYNEGCLETCKQVADTVYDFFRYYASEFDWEKGVATICRSDPTTLLKSNIEWTFNNEVRLGSPIYYRICIRDPLEQTINVARHVDGKKTGAPSIRPFFERAVQALEGDFGKLMQPLE
eukprot:GDKK01077126.1.p1 GENE.GDKK01077126.1~~GDKK01077126.1.p1  ORF type:complete len:322 (+),score=3.70 GDKK01077126.1:29-967(+)